MGLGREVAATLTASLLTAGCAALGRGGSPESLSRAAPSNPVTGWVTYRDDAHRFSVGHPSNWHRATESLTPTLTDPKEILSVGTYELRVRGQRCAQFPDRALDELGPEDALVSIQEESGFNHPERWPPGPAHFGPDSGRGDDESPGCLSRPKSFFHRWIPFQDGGRGFYAYIALGSNASAATQREAWGILDSLEPDPAPNAPSSPDCGVISPAGEKYTTVMLPNRGPPGTGVVLSGPTLRGEDGRYWPADRVEVWWNTEFPATEVPNAPPLAPGPIVRLAREDLSGRCTFSVSFSIPDVSSGRYDVRIFMYDEGGYGFFPGHTFQVAA